VHKKLTITVEQDVYAGLNSLIGRGRISAFINALVRPHVIKDELEKAYAEMAEDEKREQEAEEWSENLIGDTYNETR
jgi:predicted CopG family antitoxin